MANKKYILSGEEINTFLGKMKECNIPPSLYAGSENNFNGISVYDFNNVAVILGNFIAQKKDLEHGNMFIIGELENILKAKSKLEEKIGFELKGVKD